MTINETLKLRRLVRHSQEEFLPQGSLLNQTRLDRFILIALLIHASVIILQSLLIAKPKDSPTPPPIKVKYIDVQKPESIDKKEPLIKAPEQKKAAKQKIKSSKLLANVDSRMRANRKPSNQKKYRQTKTVTPQIRRKPNITKPTQALVKLKKAPALSKQGAAKKNTPLLPPDTEIDAPEAVQSTQPVSSEKLGSRKVLSMLDGFDVEKYAMQDTRTLLKESPNEDEPISLDTTEIKYVSYFNRIKHQIQRVWRYPAQAAQRGVSGQLTLKFQISRDGCLLGARLVDNSGINILDMAALKAVKEAAPYYPFPVTIPKKKLSILATFVYIPNSNQSNAE